jgi:hypothetical protein
LVEIPKPGGGVRQLGIPTVVDRLVQQTIAEVPEPWLDPALSTSSFGFRPGRSAHDALRQAREHVADGYDIVVDLEKFFDRVNHDIQMARLARRIGDPRLLRIVRRFRQAGMMVDGVCRDRQPARRAVSASAFGQVELHDDGHSRPDRDADDAALPLGDESDCGHQRYADVLLHERTGRRHRRSHPIVRSTTQRLGSTTNFPVSPRRTIATFTGRQTRFRPCRNFAP